MTTVTEDSRIRLACHVGKLLATCFAVPVWLLASSARAAPVVAQEQYIAYWAATIGLGQTFVWPTGAPLGIVRVVSSADITATFKLYDGTHLCDNSDGASYSQSGVLLVKDAYSTLALNTPQALVSGNTYTFCFFNEQDGYTALHYTGNTSYYPNGVYVSDGTVDPADGGGDLQFELDIAGAPPPPPPPPPDDTPRIFMTSVAGTGDFSTWPDAYGNSGIAAADEICRSRAAAGKIANAENYIALISDSNDDAYCRVHGNTGRVFVNQCNAQVLPTGAGPWYRMDGLAAMDVAQNSMVFPPDGGYVPRPIVLDELGDAFPSVPGSASLAYTATMPNGVLSNPDWTCSDWTSTTTDSPFIFAANAFQGFENIWGYSVTCDQPHHLICLEAGMHGPALPRSHSRSARAAFVTSSSGTGDLGSWPDAGGATQLDAADNICRAHARRGHRPLPETFRAWVSSTTTDAAKRFVFDGPWYRTDGVRVAESIADVTDSLLEAPVQIDEARNPVAADNVWTGTYANGSVSTHTCSDWTDGSNASSGDFGMNLNADGDWTYFLDGIAFGCTVPMRLYCFGDNDSLFLDSFDEQ